MNIIDPQRLHGGPWDGRYRCIGSHRTTSIALPLRVRGADGRDFFTTRGWYVPDRKGRWVWEPNEPTLFTITTTPIERQAA